MSESSRYGRRVYPGKAVVAISLSAAAVAMLLVFKPVALLLAVASIIASLLARREIVGNDRDRGSTLSLIAFLISLGILLFVGIPEIWWPLFYVMNGM